MSRIPIVLAVALTLAALLAAGGGGAPADAPALPREEAQKLLDAWRERQAKVRTLSARFERVEVNALFLDEVKSDGTLYLAKPAEKDDPWRLRRETDEALLVVNGDLAWVYLPGEKTAERYDLAKLRERKKDASPGLLDAMRAVVDLDAARIDERFDATIVREKDGLYRVSLAPKPKTEEEESAPAPAPAPKPEEETAAAPPKKRIKLWMDEDGVFPRRVRVEEGDDSWTETYSRVRENPRLKDSLFEFEPPRGVKVVEPARAAE